MKVYTLTDTLPSFRNPVVTLGSYDGVHYGHRVLLERVKEKSAETGGESIVVTFSPHPRQVLSRGGDVHLLNTLKEKILLLEDAGIDNLVVLPFTEEFAKMGARDFVSDIMAGRLGMKWLVVGYDHHFGRGQEGDYESLAEMGREFGFGIDRIPKYQLDDDKVSSSAVRRLVGAGDMAKAAEFLTKPYLVIGNLRGSVLVPGEKAKLQPPAGEYKVTVAVKGVRTKDTLRICHGGTMRLAGKYPDAEEILVTFD